MRRRAAIGKLSSGCMGWARANPIARARSMGPSAAARPVCYGAGTMTTLPLKPGDPAPWFVAPSPTNPRYHFDSVAGRYIVLCFFGSAAVPAVGEMLARIRQRTDLFDDEHASFFGVSCDPDDQRLQRVGESYPGYRLFWDFGFKVSAVYGACEPPQQQAHVAYHPLSFVLDPRLRILAALPITDAATHAAQ